MDVDHPVLGARADVNVKRTPRKYGMDDSGWRNNSVTHLGSGSGVSRQTFFSLSLSLFDKTELSDSFFSFRYIFKSFFKAHFFKSLFQELYA